jgi:hypothetical protein
MLGTAGAGCYADLMISLDLMIRLISSTMTELTLTVCPCEQSESSCASPASSRTLFPDQAVISIIRVVRVSRDRTTTVADYSEVELWLCRRQQLDSGLENGGSSCFCAPRNSWPKRPMWPELDVN